MQKILRPGCRTAHDSEFFLEVPLKALIARVVHDGHFWIAVILGPVVWIALWWYTGKPAPDGIALKVLLTGVVLYPVIEELAFRGFIQTWLREKQIFRDTLVGKISYANIITSFLFASFHLFNQPPLWAALVFFPSLVFGYLRDRYDAVAPSAVLHAWYNLGFFLLVL